METSAGSIRAEIAKKPSNYKSRRRRLSRRPGTELGKSMDIVELITPDKVLPRLRATCKKQALQDLARLAAEATGLDERKVFDVLLERERLGTTGVGNGIAIPHGRMEEIDGVYGLFARLEQPIDYDSIDDQPVDLIFLLLAPEDAGADHLKALARVSRLLRDRTMCEKLRESDSRDGLYALLTDSATSRAA
jgi:PTS system nitrogen regulatory IIA component